MIDNYDSFTYNLVQRIGELDPNIDLQVFRNDKITPEQALELNPDHIIISPGPCTPNEAGVSIDIIKNIRRPQTLAGRMFRSSIHRPGLRHDRRTQRSHHAWQNLPHPP